MKIRIHRNGTTYGPYDCKSVERFLNNGRASTDDLAWTPGCEDWEPLRNLLVFRSKGGQILDPRGKKWKKAYDEKYSDSKHVLSLALRLLRGFDRGGEGLWVGYDENGTEETREAFKDGEIVDD